MSDATIGGVLYYVKTCDHFAVRISEHVFHGHVGIIFSDEPNPGKVKECKYNSVCSRLSTCGYYHDPLKHIGSADHRNFVINTYSTKNKKHFGSIDRLESDVTMVTAEEISRQHDFTMHNILVSMVLMYLKK